MKRLGISQSLKDRVGLEQLILDVLTELGVAGDGGDVLHHQLARLRLAGATLPREHDDLVSAPVTKLVPGSVSQRVAETYRTHQTSKEANLHFWDVTYICGGI